jgi:hypothetical protein
MSDLLTIVEEPTEAEAVAVDDNRQADPPDKAEKLVLKVMGALIKEKGPLTRRVNHAKAKMNTAKRKISVLAPNTPKIDKPPE